MLTELRKFLSNCSENYHFEIITNVLVDKFTYTASCIIPPQQSFL